MSMDLGRDLKLRETELGADLTISPEGDLMLIEGEENLGQAIINRLRTRVGELRDLGHPRYGSTLYEMIGQPNNDRTRSLVRMIVRETIMRDRRVKEIISLTITTSKRDLNRLNIRVVIKPIVGEGVITIVFPFYLEVR